MSDYAYVADRAKKAHASVAKLESLLLREPDNRAVQINLKGMMKRALQASEELERLAAVNRIEVCKYRMVPMTGNGYSLRNVSKALLEYQNLFSQLYDSFKNGPKNRAVLGQEARDESGLEFAYSYAGSLGVVLLTRSERDFFSGNLDAPIEAIYQIIEINNIDAVRDIASTRGRAVVKRIYDWSSSLAAGGFAADIQWNRSDGKVLGEMVDRSRLESIAAFIIEAADTKTDDVDIEGILIGANRETKFFQISEINGETYKGYFDPQFEVPSELTVGGFYKASIRISDKYYYASDTHQKTNSLLSLDGPYAIQTKV
jgi:hypothetical protein